MVISDIRQEDLSLSGYRQARQADSKGIFNSKNNNFEDVPLAEFMYLNCIYSHASR